MNLIDGLYWYVFSGTLTIGLVVLFPTLYLQLLSRSLLIIKIAQNKLNQKSKKTKEITEAHEQEIENNIIDHVNRLEEKPSRINKDLFFLLVGWPMIVLIFIIAAAFRLFYLSDKDLEQKD